jgi:KAP family P-loop domain
MAIDVEPPTGLLRGVRRSPQDRGDVRLLSDEPINDPLSDYFGFAAFATALAEIVDNEKTDTPLTIALSAPWGAGKTSVASMMQRLLSDWVVEREGDRPRIVCWFNAWEHDDAAHLGAALASKVARTANRRRCIWWRLLQPLPAAMLGPQERWRRVVVMVLATGLVAALLTGMTATRRLAEQILHINATVIGAIGWLGALWIGALVWRGVFSAARDAARFVDDPASEAAKGSMSQVKSQLGRLIGQATRGGRMVIFVDDLERCRAARAVEVFEVAGQLLAHPGVVTVLLADMGALSKAAQTAYAGEAADADADLGRRYLEKLVQLELELPPPASSDMQRLLSGAPPQLPETDPSPSSQASTSSRRALTWLQVQAWAAYATALGGVFALVFAVTSGSSISTWVSSVAIFGAVGGALGAIIAVYAGVWRARARRRRQEVEEGLEEILQKSDSSEAQRFGPGDPRWREAVGDEKFDSYADKVAESIRTVRSPEIEEVERFIQRYPPRFPRGAKRMLNHARLLTKIARERDMFGGMPALTPDHLGKWIVLSERWPSLAEQIAAKHVSLHHDAQIRDLITANPRDADLERLLNEPPELAGVIERLIYFKPAASP